MKTNHAPGPWAISGKTVKSIHHQRHYAVARVDNILFTPEANEANARLIASAPDLLQALADILEISQGGVVMRHETGKPTWSALDEMAKLAQAAIAKATGET